MPSMKQISLLAATTPSRPALDAGLTVAAADADALDDTACVMEPRRSLEAAAGRDSGAIFSGGKPLAERGRRRPGLTDEHLAGSEKRASRATISGSCGMRQFALRERAEEWGETSND